MKFKRILELFLIFLKIGAFTFGGGYAMLSIIHREIVENKKFITDDEMLDIISISESTPGVISVNTATFVGYKISGFWGAIAATFGVVLPAFIIIILVTLFFIPYMSNKWINYAFLGIRAGVVVLIFNAAIKLNKVNKKNLFNISLTVISFLLATAFNINAIFILLGGLIIGISYRLIAIKRKNKEDK
ncbi:MAG: chromate transporter [Oscillospiraceae bacterium]